MSHVKHGRSRPSGPCRYGCVVGAGACGGIAGAGGCAGGDAGRGVTRRTAALRLVVLVFVTRTFFATLLSYPG